MNNFGLMSFPKNNVKMDSISEFYNGKKQEPKVSVLSLMVVF